MDLFLEYMRKLKLVFKKLANLTLVGIIYVQFVPLQ